MTVDLLFSYILLISAIIISKSMKIKSYYYIPLLVFVFLLSGPEFSTIKSLSTAYNSTQAIYDISNGIKYSPKRWLNYTYNSFEKSKIDPAFVPRFFLGSFILFLLIYTIMIFIDSMVGINPENITTEEKIVAEIIIAVISVMVFYLLSQAWTIIKL